MKILKFLLLILSLLLYSGVNGQVGINTIDPQATLHVNGKVRIDTVLPINSNKILVLDVNNNEIGYTTSPNGENVYVADVIKYGAVGDGVTNDTASIKAAFNSTYNIVFFPPNYTYIVDGTVTNTMPDRKVIATGATIKLKDNAPGEIILNNSANGFEVKGGIWDGNKSNGNSGGSSWNSIAILLDASNCSVKEATIINMFGIGVRGLGNYNEVLNCTISGTTHFGIFYDGEDGTIHKGNKANYNKIDMSSGVGEGQGILFTSDETNGGSQIDWEMNYNDIRGDNSSGVADQAINLNCRGRNGTVIGNTTRYGSMGFSEGGDDTVIMGNSFFDMVGIGYGVEPSGRQLISNNVIKGGSSGINVSEYISDGSVMIGNIIETADVGISLQPSSSNNSSSKHTVISGGYIKSKRPIILENDVTGLSIKSVTMVGTDIGWSGIFFESVLQPCNISISDCTFINLDSPLELYSYTGALTYIGIFVTGTNTIDVTQPIGFKINNSNGTVTIGDRCKMINNNSSQNTSENIDIIDGKLNILEYSGGTFPDPNGNVRAGMGSKYSSINGVYYFKQTGTGNTGWVQIL